MQSRSPNIAVAAIALGVLGWSTYPAAWAQPQYAPQVRTLAQASERQEHELIRQRRIELEEARRKFAAGSVDLLLPIARLGYALMDNGRPIDAEPLFREQISIAESKNPPGHINQAWGHFNLGEAMRRGNRCPDAMPHLATALRMRSAQLAVDHVDIGWSHNAIGLCHLAGRRFTEAEESFQKAKSIHEKAKGPTSPEVATVMLNLGDLYRQSDRLIPAEQALRAALTYREQAFGARDTRLFTPLNWLGHNLIDQGRLGDAEPVFRRLLEAAEEKTGKDSLWVSHSLMGLADTFQRRGEATLAEPLAQRALDIRRRFIPDSTELGWALNLRAHNQWTLLKYNEAEVAFRAALSQFERVRGAGSAEVASVLVGLGNFLGGRARYAEAEAAITRSLEIRQRLFGEADSRTADSMAALAALYRRQEKLADADFMMRKALTVLESRLGPDHPKVAQTLRDVASNSVVMGRFAEGEAQYRRALSILSQKLGAEHPTYIDSLTHFGWVYWNQGRHNEAVSVFDQANGLAARALPKDHTVTAWAQYSLGIGLRSVGRRSEAFELLKASLDTRTQKFGPNHPITLDSLSDYATMLAEARRFTEAEPLLQRAVTAAEASQGPLSPLLAGNLDKLSRVYFGLGRFADAEQAQRKALHIREQTLGPDHPRTGWSLNRLAYAIDDQGRSADALPYARRATELFKNRAERAKADGDRAEAGLAEQLTARGGFFDHISILYRIQEREPTQRPSVIAEAFEVMQLAQATGTEAAIARMAARFATGTDALASTVREREDLINRWRTLDGQLAKSLGKGTAERDAAAEERLRKELEGIDRRLQDIDAKVSRDFPEYGELSSPKPVALKDVQSLLAEDEAMLIWLSGNRRTFIFALRRDRAEFARVNVGRGEIASAVRELRRSLDPTNVSSLADIPAFNTTRAHQLYRDIFQPAEALIKGARVLFVIADGGLQSLPLGVLVTEPTELPLRDFGLYRRVPWLARQYAISVLPSVGSLKSIRRFARAAQGSKPFIGIGDPKLDGSPGATRGLNVAQFFKRGAVADADEIRKLPPLPDTADELRAIARTLGAAEADLFLGIKANEAEVRRSSLGQYRIVAFATHGLMAGEFADVGEPALVLTPPGSGTAEDDGLLTTSEIASLKLDADWVILSACNTAAPDGTPGAEGLSGLAKAFLYAGSRALLVSHWAVLSDAAVKLTTTMLDEGARDAQLPRAEAHRRATLALIADDENPHYAHPMFWAPFVVVGEGGAAARR